jgi:predicted ATPase/DNA-binding winged helix-turn-helix (wHTH) protein
MPQPPATPGLETLPPQLRFGRFELRHLECRLLADGQPVALGGRAYELLLALLQRAGRVVPRNELIDAVWPGRVVEENNLSVQVKALRKVLGNELLLTVPGRGYRLVVPGLGAHPAPALPAAPPAAAVSAPAGPRTQLPAMLSPLIGRADDLQALGDLVDAHRLVTVVGAGGTGKTRLALALLQGRQGRYTQGVCMVDLGPVTEAARLPGAVATALGLRTPPAAVDGAAADHAGLLQALAEQQLLVALDNAEHLVADVAQLARELLAAAPGLRLLVTSQAPLRLAEERVMRLQGLATPSGPLPAGAAQGFGAVALFCERAQAADSRWQLTEADVPAVVHLCRQLDGLPLAIELAAARVPLLGVERLAAALPERLRLLTANRNRDAPARQQTLRAALRWSHDLLAEPEQRLFRRLAVMAGSAPLPLVQAVAQGPDEPADPWAVLDSLDELVQRGLVDVQMPTGPDTEPGDPAEPRYRLLESPRALALELLAASGEETAVRIAHAHAMAQQLALAEQALHAGRLGVEAWRHEGELDLDNARAALTQARAVGDTGLVLALGAALLPRLPGSLHDERLALADLVEPLIAAFPDAALRLRAWLGLYLALAHTRPQRSDAAAQQALAEARQSAATTGDPWPLYRALCSAVGIVHDAAEAAQAQALLDEARALEDPSWPPIRRREAVRLQVMIAVGRGMADESLQLQRQLLALGLAAGDPSLMTRINLADTELRAGHPRAAADSGEVLVTLLERQRDTSRLAYARINLAAAWLALDETHRARIQLQQAWPAAHRLELQGWCADYLSLLAAAEGRHEAAARLQGAAEARYAAGSEPRQANETAACERARAVATQALGTARFEALHRAGIALSDAELAALGLSPAVP